MPDLSALFKSVKLPVMSEVAHALIRTLHEEDASIAQVRDIIAKDPTLTAKVLRAANSASLGARREISSLDNAITMVGMAQVRTLALTACMNVAFPNVSGLDRNEFWRNSMACAGYSKWLAGGLGFLGIDSQQAWLTGMMARLGELIIGQFAPGSLAEIEKQPHIPGDRWKREQRMLGFTETQVTAELARRWNFPADIVRGLETASSPLDTLPFFPLGAVVHLAGWLADMPFSEPVIVDALPDDVITRLDLNRNWMRENIPQPDSFFDISTL
jgi:HD-like signal output (HDOD) protein